MDPMRRTLGKMTIQAMAIVTDQEPAARPAARALDTLLAAFAAGRLKEAFAVLVAAHLELKADSRGLVADLETAGGILLDAIEPVALSRRDCQLAPILAPRPRGSRIGARVIGMVRITRAKRYFLRHCAPTLGANSTNSNGPRLCRDCIATPSPAIATARPA